MRFLFASDSFKGTLTSREIHAILAQTLATLSPASSFEAVSVADGGEGTLEAFEDMGVCERIEVDALDALGRPIKASFIAIDDKVAIIESAQAAGLPQIEPELRNPLKATSFGLGEIIHQAVTRGFQTIYIGLGGTATNDAATGALSALGFRFTDAKGTALQGTGENLAHIARVDTTNVSPLVFKTRFRLLTDVTNPLLGAKGAQAVFAPQKGATPEMVQELEAGMAHFFSLTQKAFHAQNFAGAGAAGGMAFGFKTFLGADVTSGIQTVLELSHFEEKVKACDAIITGEGCVDGQTADGKVMSGILAFAKRLHKPVIAITGDKKPGYEALFHEGLTELVTLREIAGSSRKAMTEAKAIYAVAAERVLSDALQKFQK